MPLLGTIKTAIGLLALLVALYLFFSCTVLQLWTQNKPFEIELSPTPNADFHTALMGLNASGELLPRVARLDCGKMLGGDEDYIEEYRKKRITMDNDPAELDISCEAIKARWRFGDATSTSRSTNKSQTSHEEERGFPLAFARTVFRDYLLLEQMLSAEYEPWNYYCYSLDAKAGPKLKKRVRQLAKCFPNVVVVRKEYSVYSSGKNVSRSHLACVEELLAMGDGWKYILLLQNHDIPHKTNRQKVRILREFGGANDVATNKMRPERVNSKLDWSLTNLALYRNGSLLSEVVRLKGNANRLYHTKSLNLVALSRAAAEFVVTELDLTTFVNQLERGKYGMDEALFSTLNSNLPNFPGGFTTYCLREKKKAAHSVGRYVVWRADESKCKSRKFRHTVCIFGAEDLANLANFTLVPHLYFNKILPMFDYGSAYCWLKSLSVRSKSEEGVGMEGTHRLNLNPS